MKDLILKMLFLMVLFIKINTPQFNLVIRSQYGNGCDFKHEKIEYRGKNCFTPTKEYCFVEYITFLTGKDYKQQYLDVIRNENRRSKTMTKARIEPFYRANDFNLGYFVGTRAFPYSIADKDDALFLYNNRLCLIWKSEGVSFSQAIKELKDNLKIVDNYKIEKNANSHFEYIYTFKKLNLIQLI